MFKFTQLIQLPNTELSSLVQTMQFQHLWHLI